MHRGRRFFGKNIIPTHLLPVLCGHVHCPLEGLFLVILVSSLIKCEGRVNLAARLHMLETAVAVGLPVLVGRKRNLLTIDSVSCSRSLTKLCQLHDSRPQ